MICYLILGTHVDVSMLQVDRDIQVAVFVGYFHLSNPLNMGSNT